MIYAGCVAVGFCLGWAACLTLHQFVHGTRTFSHRICKHWFFS